MNNKNDRNKMGSYYCNYYYDKIGEYESWYYYGIIKL